MIRNNHPTRYTFRWAMIPDGIPLAHQRCEAIADLMDTLRSEGLMILSEPTTSIQHGARPVMTITCTVRPTTKTERHQLTPLETAA